MYSFSILGFLFVCAQIVANSFAIDIAGCFSSGSRVYCNPIYRSIPQFIGARISGYDEFRLNNRWTLSTFPYKTFANFKGIKNMHLNNAGLRYLECDTFVSIKDSLESLSLYNNILTEIEQCTFRNLSSLIVLNLRLNEIEHLDEFSLFTLDNLTTVYLSSNSLSEILENTFCIRTQDALKYIGLSYNKIATVHKHAFDKHKNLETLLLNSNKLTGEIWKALNLLKLKTLNLAHNMIETVDSSVLNSLENIEVVDLSHNFIKSLHGVYLRSGVMKRISVAYNNIGVIHTDCLSPTKTFSKTSSVTIDFSNNDLKSLHMNLPECKQSSCNVYLHNNVLSGLTFSYIGENKVYRINVERNNLTKLSDSFPFATYQHLSNNPLSSKSAVNFLQTKLRYTRYLYMSNISLFCFGQENEMDYTKGINISSIRRIDLSNNCIQGEFVCFLLSSSFPTGILDLNLDFNHFTSFPECIFGISGKIKISIRYNTIAYFNFSMDFNSIVDIDFEGNVITDIPLTFRTLQNVKLKNNQLTNVENLTVWQTSLEYQYVCSIDFSNNSIQAIESINIKHVRRFSNWYCSHVNLDMSSNSLTVFPNITLFDFVFYSLTVSFENNSLTDIKPVNIQSSVYISGDINLNYMGNNIEEINEPIYLVNGELLNEFRTKIDLSNNSLSTYPSCDLIAANTSYVHIAGISLSNNRLTLMPGLDDMDYCYMYTSYLHLEGNEIKIIPSVIGGEIVSIRKFTVRHLTLRNNNMEFITNMAFSKLVNLWNLDLSSNLLTTLPTGLDALQILSYLDISSNFLAALPKELNTLKSLYSLDVSNNRIIHFTYEPSPLRVNEFYPMQIYLKNNPIHCSCSIAWLRDNDRIKDKARCSTPIDKTGYHVACFPINDCDKILSTRPGKQTLNRCSSEEGMFGVQIDINTRVLNDRHVVSWISYRPYNVHKFQVISKKKGEELSRILLNSEQTTYSLTDVHADEICVFAVNDSIAPLFGKCMNLSRGLEMNSSILKTHSDKNRTYVECSSENCSDTTVLTIILATVVALSIAGNLTLIIMKCRTHINDKRTTEEIKRNVEKERVSADNPIELDDIDQQDKSKHAVVYEKARRPESVESQIYEELDKQ